MNKVLIVTEDQTVSSHIQLVLSRGGFYTALVGGVQEMIRFCKVHTPDLMLLDVDIDRDGELWASVHAVRALGTLANLPILGLSNVGAPETLQKAKDFGFCGLMPKETPEKTLISAIQSIMIEARENQNTTPVSSLGQLINISEEVESVANGLKTNIEEFGADGAELFSYITNSSNDIRSKLSEIKETDLADKDLRHDFRNMIGSVTGFSELILMEPNLSPLSEKGLSRLRECSKEFVELLDQQKAAAGA